MQHLPGTRFTNINLDPNMDKYSYDECGFNYLSIVNFNDCTIEVWEWMNNLMDAVTYHAGVKC